MDELKVVTLPSGAMLKISLSPFKVARELYRAVLEEAKGLKFDPKQEIDVNMFKDLFCTAVSSRKIEETLWECFKKATYNGLGITEDTFEPLDARDDYLTACLEVAKVNILPFTKSLFAQYGTALGEIRNVLGLK